MGGERNTLRQFLRDGRPAALGVHVIGDARCQTNSAYAWGSRHALEAACAVRDVIAEHGDDPEAQALALDQRLAPELAGASSTRGSSTGPGTRRLATSRSGRPSTTVRG